VGVKSEKYSFKVNWNYTVFQPRTIKTCAVLENFMTHSFNHFLEL